MAMQRKKRGQDQIQPPASVKSSNLFAPFESESAASADSSAETLTRDSATLELRRKQASQGGFNFGNVSLFASAQTHHAIGQGAATVQRQPENVLQREGNDNDEQLWGQNVTVDGKTYPWVVPLHGNAYANAGKTLSGGEDVLPPTPDLQDKVGNQPQRLGFNPGKYPNITSDALRTYSEEVLQGDINSQESLSASVMESAPQIGYKFDANESGSIYSIHLSPGNLFATLTPTAQVEDMKGFMQSRGALAGGKVAKNQVTEHCPQHCGTHYPGTPPSGSHMHHYNSGGMPMKNVANALKVAEATGTITSEGANNARQATGLPVQNKPQQDK